MNNNNIESSLDNLMFNEVASPWENGAPGPLELLFEFIEVCPIDEHITMGVI